MNLLQSVRKEKYTRMILLVLDGTAAGYAGIHYSETMQKQYPIDLLHIEKKMYGNCEFYSDIDLAGKGIEIISQHFDMGLM